MPGAVATGFYGKIPVRGDFVRAGLPRGFLDVWDDWMQQAIAGSRAILDESWVPAWMEAPIWRFAFSGGVCGPEAALGVWMPSVDRAGRHFPLLLAAIAPGALAVVLERAGAAWLDAAEAVGLAALREDLDPPAITQRLSTAPALVVGDDAQPSAPALWWTDGGPRVPPCRLALTALPDAAAFAAMLDARHDHAAEGGTS